MLLPLTSRWKTIGTLLDIPQDVLNKIQSDEDEMSDNCLRVMLSEWLKQVDPPPTWKDLADAVDDVDKRKAKEIRDQCVDLDVIDKEQTKEIRDCVLPRRERKFNVPIQANLPKDVSGPLPYTVHDPLLSSVEQEPAITVADPLLSGFEQEPTIALSQAKFVTSVDEERDRVRDIFAPQVKQSAFFAAAEKNARVPFLNHQLLECDSSGREWTSEDHDITLRIPEGALAEGEKVHFEVGVAMYGPFIFPENTQPISPILWLCILEEDVELKKPFQVVLPHYLTGLPKERVQYHQVGFAKASHNNYSVKEDGQVTYEFEKSEIEPIYASSGHKNYGVLVSNHCCFYCLEAPQTEELAKDSGYCLARIESCISPSRYEIYFSAMYFLLSCCKSLEQQFPKEEGYHIAYKPFKYVDEKSELIIEIGTLDHSQHDQCVIALDPMEQRLRAEDIPFGKVDSRS